MGYILAIDIGIASIGFSGVDIPHKNISFCGVHLFDTAENPKDGSSLALPRREKRGLRRIIHRRAVRKRSIRKLLLDYGFENVADIDLSKAQSKTGAGNPPVTPWDLRKAALERKLTDGEFSRVVFHIVSRRGFQSNRKGAEPNDLEGKKALSGAKALEEAMLSAGSTTIGAYLATLSKQRNGNGSYDNFITRDLLRSEINKIFETQRKLGNQKITEEFKKKYEEIAFYQRPLQSSEKLVGYCSLEPEEKRAPKFSYTAELFIIWSKLNNLRIRSISGDERPLNQDEKNRLVNKAHTLKSQSYKQARKELGLTDDERFNITYRKVKEGDNSWDSIRDSAEKSDFLKLPGYHALKAVLGTQESEWSSWTTKKLATLDEIARILSFYEDDKDIQERLAKLGLDQKLRAELCTIVNFSKTLDLSLKAINEILPFMQEGLTYDKACKEAGYEFSHKASAELRKLPQFEDTRNPVVNRALAQSRKVVNAILRKHGMPETIVIELARDVGKNFKDRKDYEREQKKNEANREEARKHIEEEILGGRTASGDDIIKYRLWKDQEAWCCYCGCEITPQTLRDPVATQVDHIIPYSRSWDDSYMNKIVCHTDCNQQKGNRTPFEWLGSTNRWEGLQAIARKLPSKKAEKLLQENFNDEKSAIWKERNLNGSSRILVGDFGV